MKHYLLLLALYAVCMSSNAADTLTIDSITLQVSGSAFGSKQTGSQNLTNWSGIPTNAVAYAGQLLSLSNSVTRINPNGLLTVGTDGLPYYLQVHIISGAPTLLIFPAPVLPMVTNVDFTAGAAYAFNRVVPSYDGPTVRLRRDSDGAESDFGFNPFGVFETNVVNEWGGGSILRGVAWYDQTTNGNHAVQPTSANQQTYEYSAADGAPCFVGGSIVGSYARFWNLPAGVAQNPRSFSTFMVYKAKNLYPHHPMWLGLPGAAVGAVPSGTTLTTDGAAAVSSRPVEGVVTIGHGSLGYVTNGVLPSDNVVEVLSVVSTSTNVSTLAGTRWDASVGAAVPRFGSQVPAGGVLGRYLTGSTLEEGEARAYLIARETTVTNARVVAAVLAENHRMRVGFTNSVWWVGDSISAGFQETSDFRERAPAAKLAQMQTNHFMRLFARAGQRVDQLDTVATTASGGTAVDRWAGEFGAGNARVLLWAGYNDLAQGASLATVKARINTFIANRKAAGFTKVYVGTLIPVGSYISPDSLRTDLNAWLMAGSSDADGVVDFAGLGNWSGKMQPDGVHLTEPAGNAEAARVMKAFLDSL